MITLPENHGLQDDPAGTRVVEMINAINERFTTPGHTVEVHFVANDYAIFRGDGSAEYGHFEAFEEGVPKIFVATDNRPPEQIAGTIAYEYGKYLQWRLGNQAPTRDNAAAFARHMLGHPGFEQPPAAIVECGAEVGSITLAQANQKKKKTRKGDEPK